MNFMEMLKSRESCRSFDGTPATREELLKIVEAGHLSPSGCNAQPWKFIIVDEEDALAKVRDALVTETGATGAPWREEVSSYIVIVEVPAKVKPAVLEHYNDSQRFAQGDIGMAVMNMCYEAMELGLATCILGMNDQKKMEEYFNIPEGNEVRMILAVGHPKKETEPRDKVRKAFDEVCSFNQW
ncbi:MAG: nitroreductase family protein [Lachnospiraceae bacterium]|nr:nitroreductase family protein [Lachnospiraceae bacterium]